MYYVKLFQSLVIPLLVYGCEVWRPYTAQEIYLVERVRNIFISRVSFRCRVDKSIIRHAISAISVFFDNRDEKLFRKIMVEDFKDKFLQVTENARRSGLQMLPHGIAPTDKNLFAWRLSRRFRSPS